MRVGNYLQLMLQQKLIKGESNKLTIDQELTAIHWAIKHFRPYVYGKHFLVFTDHRPLSYLFSMKLHLEEYDFTVEYLKQPRYDQTKLINLPFL